MHVFNGHSFAAAAFVRRRRTKMYHPTTVVIFYTNTYSKLQIVRDGNQTTSPDDDGDADHSRPAVIQGAGDTDGQRWSSAAQPASARPVTHVSLFT